MNEERQRLIERSVTFPTPTAQDYRHGDVKSRLRRVTQDLRSVAEIFPNAGDPGREEVRKIAKEFQESERCIYPTVTKSGMGGCTGSRQKLDKLRDGGLITAEERTAMRRGWPGGKLNPDWVEWLMGWPIGWTALKHLETVKSPLAPPQPS